MADLTLLERVVALEEKKLKLDDLPISDIIKKIELQGIDVTTIPPMLGGSFTHFDGAVGTGGPPGPTSGILFSVPSGGQYLVVANSTGYVTAAPVSTVMNHYIDGALAIAEPSFFNVANQHLSLGARYAVLNLTSGSHYWWVQMTGALTNNTDDHHSLATVRIG